jgi:hypothetical protein
MVDSDRFFSGPWHYGALRRRFPLVPARDARRSQLASSELSAGLRASVALLGPKRNAWASASDPSWRTSPAPAPMDLGDEEGDTQEPGSEPLVPGTTGWIARPEQPGSDADTGTDEVVFGGVTKSDE